MTLNEEKRFCTNYRATCSSKFRCVPTTSTDSKISGNSGDAFVVYLITDNSQYVVQNPSMCHGDLSSNVPHQFCMTL